MIISKEKFVEIINRLRDYNDLQDKIDDLFKEYIDNKEMDFMNAGSICIGHESVVDENMNEIDLSTAEKLYDYLVQSLESEGE